MRWRTTFAAIGLVAAMGMLSGCKTWCDKAYPCTKQHVGDPPPPDGRGPWVKRGVIRAERDGVLIGYASTDPGDETTQLWLLRHDEYFPFEMAPGMHLDLEYLPLDPLTHQQLCEWFGAELSNNGAWPPPVKWKLWSGYMPIGPCP